MVPPKGRFYTLLKTFIWLTAFLAFSMSLEAATKRPRITGIATFAAKVDNLEEARKFYGGVIGMAEAFKTKDADVQGDLVAFKVNDRQYVEISPTLKSDAEDRLIRI